MKKTETVALRINGQTLSVRAGTSVAAALRIAGSADMGTARRSVLGQARAPFCGMGICHECRVDIDGRRRLACQTRCEDGMVVETSA
ncbi:(2Fe-2S)-binding protein [Rhodoferax koreense]|uniref:(2Fe-2S)-binding protein n=1 Tax=Rhodoferax koreensis TaxID=1842727 RepID=A0A1P8JVX4_9BURK|nr:(2Fe-2S)-binding protein [Rhodoferax koreense]APW37926.1 (2Fe-2S)-binding protein [Rhodoferax koreense]